MTCLTPILVGVLFAAAMSLIREPHRRRFNAIMVAGAGAAYLSGGGFGGWEFLAVIALWCLRGGPSLIGLVRGRAARPRTVDQAPPV